MFFGTYIFAEKHMFFVRPLLEHDVYEKVPCKKHMFFRMHPQRAPKSMFSCRSIFLKMEQDRPTREHGFGCPLGMHAEKHMFFARHLSANIYVPKNICF